MDFASLITGVILVTLCVFPFVLIYRNRKKRENNLLVNLKKQASEQNCSITQFEIVGNSIIGLDKNMQTLFFLYVKEDKETFHFIRLEEIQMCKLVNSSNTIQNKDGDRIVIEKLELHLFYLDTHKDKAVLEFYNAETGDQLMGELQLIDKWCKIINASIKP